MANNNTPFFVTSDDLNQYTEERGNLTEKLWEAETIDEWKKAIFEYKLKMPAFEVLLAEEGVLETLLDDIRDDIASWRDDPEEMKILTLRHNRSKEFLEDLWNYRRHLMETDSEWHIFADPEYGEFDYDECVKGAIDDGRDGYA